jgi:glycosyltransferase involved in cell wall biosynthesis
MKIVYFAHSLLSRGGDKMVLAHAGWLASHGHDVELCCNVVKTVLEIPEGVRISRPLLPGIVGTLLSALLQRKDADVVLASIIPMACFLFPRSRRRVVYFAQDYDESYYISPILKLLVRTFYYVGLRLFRIPTISVSHPLADLLRVRFRSWVDVVENGVDTKVFFPDPEPELIASKGERKAVLLLSRSDRRKGFDIAQDVINWLSKSHPDIFEVWTVGEPCKGLFPGVVHRDFGYIGEGKLRRVMSSADIFFYPTRHEGLPLMPLEALACSCPVVTTTAVPYGHNEPSIIVTEIGDVDSMCRILKDFMEKQSPFEDFKRHVEGFVRKYDITLCTRRFEHLLVKIVGVNK